MAIDPTMLGGNGGQATPPLFSSGGAPGGASPMGGAGGDPKQALAMAQILQLLRGGQPGAAGGGVGMGNLMQLLAAKQQRQPGPGGIPQQTTSVPMGGTGGIQS